MKSILLGLILALSFTALSQIEVESVGSIEEAVRNLEGSGVRISNISFTLPSNEAVGAFTDDFGALGVESGLLLTNGSATNAIGPNNSARISTDHGSTEVPFAPFDSAVGIFNDLTLVEFDIQVSTNFLEFTYVFGSDEYPEFLDFNDVFGFYISGPGIAGTQNLAIVPGTINTPVSVSNINGETNSNLYVSNGSGNTPLQNIDVQYDGYTVPLTAQIRVIPCETYRIQLAIADAGDGQYDSGVFIEDNSFVAKNKPELSITYEYEQHPFALEGCNKAFITLGRGDRDILQPNIPVTYRIELLGNASENLDYIHNVPSQVTLPAGVNNITFEFDPLLDTIAEISETVIFRVSSGCLDLFEAEEIQFEIREDFEVELNNPIFCNATEVAINNPSTTPYELTWDTYPELSCSTCQSPTVVLQTDPTWYRFIALDSEMGCTAQDSILIRKSEVNAAFSIISPDCYTSRDVEMVNESSLANAFLWEFTTGQRSTETSPIVQLGDLSDPADTDVGIRLIAFNETLGCSDTTEITWITVENPFIPNVITPNDDQKNDRFITAGLIGQCWTLEVFNRYGKKVYERFPYQNEWSAEGLKDGVYYYELRNVDNNRIFKGPVTVIR